MTAHTYAPAAISAWLQAEAEIPADRADAAAVDLAPCWDEGDYEYQTVKDVLGDHFTNDDPRPKLVADDLAAAFEIELT